MEVDDGAPASAASIEACAISSGVIGRCGDIVGVWMPPVGEQVMMTGFDMSHPRDRVDRVVRLDYVLTKADECALGVENETVEVVYAVLGQA